MTDAPPDQSPPSPRKKLTVTRLLGFSCVAVLLVLGLMEISAAGIERFVLPHTRELPSPRPYNFNQLSDVLLKQIAADRQRLGWPEVVYGTIPLGPPSELGMFPNQNQNNPDALYRSNHLGLRGPDPAPRLPGEVRIMTIGDSSIFGDGVKEPEIFSSVAATRLATAWKRPVTTVIGAIPGHDTRQSSVLLFRYIDELRPTWVVIGNLWSDIYRQDQTGGAGLDYDALDAMPNQTLARETTAAAHSASIQHADAEQLRTAQMRLMLRRFATYRVFHYLLSPWLTAQKVRFITSKQDIGALKDGPLTRVPLPEYVENLRKMVKLAKGVKARVAFLCLPAPMDLDPAPIPETVRAFRLAMKAVADDNNAPFLDGPKLFTEKKATLGYFRDQVHPAPEGHALLGEALSDLLEKAGAPPEGSSLYP